MSYYLYANLLRGIVALVNTSETTTHFYKVKSCDGIRGNESAGAFALQAAKDPAKADTCRRSFFISFLACSARLHQ
eukprot:1154634-Pelagomonas_calceolata.AAC.4